jgi:hypothetical protein
MDKIDQNKEIAMTMESFIGQFGKIDIYAQIVLEEFMKELIKQNDLHISSEERQAGD